MAHDVDGMPGPGFREVGVPAWSTSGRLAYSVRHLGGLSVVLDHQAGPAYAALNLVDGVACRFTADGEHVAWAGQTGDKSQPIVDQDPGPWYEGVGRPLVRADRIEWFGLRDGAMWRVTATRTLGLRPWLVETAPPYRSPAHLIEPDRRYWRNREGETRGRWPGFQPS